MPDTVDIAGKPVKKQTVFIAAGAAAVLGIAFFRYRKQQAADAATAAANAAAQAPGTGAGSSDQIDPATGFPYGSAEDASALTAQAGYNSPIGGLGYSDTSYLYGGSPSAGYPTSGGFTSNAQWSQAAEDYLVNTAGADLNTVGNALGKYITGQVVNDAQQAVIHEAVAFEGYPPVSGPDGYPPSIRTAPPTPTPTPTPGGSTTVAVPNVVGQTAGNAHNILVAKKFTPVDGNWKKGDASKKVTRQNPTAGKQAAPGSIVVYYHA